MELSEVSPVSPSVSIRISSLSKCQFGGQIYVHQFLIAPRVHQGPFYPVDVIISET